MFTGGPWILTHGQIAGHTTIAGLGLKMDQGYSISSSPDKDKRLVTCTVGQALRGGLRCNRASRSFCGSHERDCPFCWVPIFSHWFSGKPKDNDSLGPPIFETNLNWFCYTRGVSSGNLCIRTCQSVRKFVGFETGEP